MARWWALLAAVAAIGVMGAGPGGFDKIRVSGSVPDELATGESAKELRDRVLEGIVSPDHLMTPPCGADRLYEFLGVKVVTPADPLAIKYAEGSDTFYIVSVRSTGCGQSRVHNLYAFPRPGPIHLLVTTPGETMVKSLELQLNLQRALYETVQVKDKCADEALIVNSEVVERPAVMQDWVEIWMAQTCGVSSRFKITFSSSETGTSFSILPMV